VSEGDDAVYQGDDAVYPHTRNCTTTDDNVRESWRRQKRASPSVSPVLVLLFINAEVFFVLRVKNSCDDAQLDLRSTRASGPNLQHALPEPRQQLLTPHPHRAVHPVVPVHNTERHDQPRRPRAVRAHHHRDRQQ